MATRDFGRITAAVSAAAAEQLHAEGFAVCDNILGQDWALALLAEQKALVEAGLMREHKFQFGRGQFRKPHIYEADMHDTALRDDPRHSTPEIDAFFSAQPLATALNARLPLLALTPEPERATLKFQYNAGGGGCFPCHYDNAGAPNKRQVTCLFYFNQAWKDGDGGELELTPFLRPAVRIAPLLDRAVLFLSDRVLHRVLPAAQPRYCFTVWIDGAAVNGPADTGLSAKDLGLDDSAVAALCASPKQRAVSRAVYAEEYATSLRECMGDSEGSTEMQQSHAEHVAQQAGHKLLAPFVAGLRERKPVGSAATVIYDAHAAPLEVRCGACEVVLNCSSADGGGGGCTYLRCSQCEDAAGAYCHEACQAKHWPTHRLECLRFLSKR